MLIYQLFERFIKIMVLNEMGVELTEASDIEFNDALSVIANNRHIWERNEQGRGAIDCD